MNTANRHVFIGLFNTSAAYEDLSDGLSLHCQNSADYTVRESRNDVLEPLHCRSELEDAVQQARRQHDDPTICLRAGHPILLIQTSDKRDITDAWKWMRSNRINIETGGSGSVGDRFWRKSYDPCEALTGRPIID